MRIAIVLAAGRSRRFGRGDKLRARLMGFPVLAHAVARARGAGAGRILIVVPTLHPGPLDIAQDRLVPGSTGLLDQRPMVLPHGGSRTKSGMTVGMVVARDAHLGMGASLKAGLAALRPIEREVLIFLGDMPFAAMPRGMRLRAGIDAVRPIHRSKPGHPLLVRTSVAKAIVQRDDRGLIAGLARDRVARVAGTAGNILDIDTVAALARVRRRIAGVGAFDRERR